MTTTGAPSGRSSAGLSVRPSDGCIPRRPKTFAVVLTPDSFAGSPLPVRLYVFGMNAAMSLNERLYSFHAT
jgi:hypothetical protein